MTVVAASVGFGKVPASDPPADPLGLRESESRESFPTHTVLELVPVGIRAIATVPVERSLADPLVAIAARPETAPDEIAIDDDPAAVILPSAPTVNVPTDDADPYDPAVTVVAASVGFGYVPESDPPADPLGLRESESLESLPAQ